MTGTRRPFPSLRHAVSQDLINAYAELSGDFNPLHVDPAIAARSPFGSTIAHGPIALQVFFAAVTRWHGAEALPPGSTVKVVFLSPVRPGDEVRCAVVTFDETTGLTTIDAECVVGDRTVVALRATVPEEKRSGIP